MFVLCMRHFFWHLHYFKTKQLANFLVLLHEGICNLLITLCCHVFVKKLFTIALLEVTFHEYVWHW